MERISQIGFDVERIRMIHDFIYFRIHLMEQPQVYEMFKNMALQAAQHRDNYGARAIVEVMRWNSMINDEESSYKIDHNWCPYYARRFMLEFPQYKGFFSLNTNRGVDYWKNSTPEDYGIYK